MNPVSPRIAVLDDEEPVRTALVRLLRASGMSAEAFDCGFAFLASLNRGAWDCIVLDLHMPELSGFEVLERLAARGTAPPAVAITGNHSAEARARVLAAGAIAYLPKPVDELALLGAIDLALRPPS